MRVPNDRITTPKSADQNLRNRLIDLTSDIANKLGVAIDARVVWTKLDDGASGAGVFNVTIATPGDNQYTYNLIAKSIENSERSNYNVFIEKLDQAGITQLLKPIDGVGIATSFRVERHAKNATSPPFKSLYSAINDGGAAIDLKYFMDEITSIAHCLRRHEKGEIRFSEYYIDERRRLPIKLLPDKILKPQRGCQLTVKGKELDTTGSAPPTRQRGADRAGGYAASNGLVKISAEVDGKRQTDDHAVINLRLTDNRVLFALPERSWDKISKIETSDQIVILTDVGSLKPIDSYFDGLIDSNCLVPFSRLESSFPDETLLFVSTRHCDLHQGNVLVNDRNWYIIDWDSHRLDLFCSDFARLFISILFNCPDDKAPTVTELKEVIEPQDRVTSVITVSDKPIMPWVRALWDLFRKERHAVLGSLGSIDFELDKRLSLLVEIARHQRYWLDEMLPSDTQTHHIAFARICELLVPRLLKQAVAVRPAGPTQLPSSPTAPAISASGGSGTFSAVREQKLLSIAADHSTETFPVSKWWSELEPAYGGRRQRISITPSGFEVSVTARPPAPPLDAVDDATLVVDADGRVAARLQAGQLSIAWLNRQDVTKNVVWHKMLHPELARARLLGLRMIGDHGICAIASTNEHTYTFRSMSNEPQAIDLRMVHGSPTRDATFVGNGVIMIPASRDQPSIEMLGLGLDKIELIDTAATLLGGSRRAERRRVWVAVGLAGKERRLVIKSLNGPLTWESLPCGLPQCLVIVRNSGPSGAIALYADDKIHCFDIPTER